MAYTLKVSALIQLKDLQEQDDDRNVHSNGIVSQQTVPYSFQWNGVAEPHDLGKARIMIHDERVCTE